MKPFFQIVMLLLAFALAKSLPVYAVEQDFGASASFRLALSLSDVRDMDFGTIEYSGPAENIIHLRTNSGQLTCTNNTDYQCPSGGATRGGFRINGDVGSTVDISCDEVGFISNGNHTLPYRRVRGRINGVNNRCRGIDTVVHSHVLTGNPEDNLLATGMQIVVDAQGIQSSGIYNTSNAGADVITFRLVYQ